MEDMKVIIFEASEMEEVPPEESPENMSSIEVHQTLKMDGESLSRNTLLTKEELEFMLSAGEESHNFAFGNKKKNPRTSARWENFHLIFYKGQEQEYIRCKHCHYLVAHKKGSGLAGLIRHRCDRRRRPSQKFKKSKPVTLAVTSVPESAEVTTIAAYQLEYVVTDLVDPSCMEGIGFQRLAQSLVLYGAQHGSSMPALITSLELESRVLPTKVNALRMKIGQLLVQEEVAFSFEVWETCSNKACVSLDGQCLTDDFRICSFHMGSRIIKDDSVISIRNGLVSIIKDYVTAAEEILSKNVLVGDEIICAAAAIDEIMKAAEYKGGPLSAALRDGYKIHLDESSDPLDNVSQFYKMFRDCYSSLTSVGKTTINEVYLWRTTLQNHLRPTENDEAVVIEMKDKAALSMHKFKLHEYHYIGLFLDPRFKSLKCCTSEERIKVLEMVKQAMGQEECDDAFSSQTIKPKQDSYFQEFLDSDDEGNSANIDSPIENELNRYLEWKTKGCDILQFWSMNHRFPRLKMLAKKILNIPAAAQRNIFAEDVKIYLEKRRFIENENMDQVLFLNQNLSKGFISSLNNL